MCVWMCGWCGVAVYVHRGCSVGRGGVGQCAVGDMVWCMWYMICVGVCMGVWNVCVCV